MGGCVSLIPAMERLLASFLGSAMFTRHIWVAKKWRCLQICALQSCECKMIFFGLWLASEPSRVKDKWKHPCWRARGFNTLTAGVDFSAANPSTKLGWAVHKHTDNNCFACFGLIWLVTVWIAHVSLRHQITHDPPCLPHMDSKRCNIIATSNRIAMADVFGCESIFFVDVQCRRVRSTWGLPPKFHEVLETNISAAVSVKVQARKVALWEVADSGSDESVSLTPLHVQNLYNLLRR